MSSRVGRFVWLVGILCSGNLLLAAKSVQDRLAQPPKVIDGYPVANFALTVNAYENGDFYGKIMQNSGKLGEWLVDKGSVLFYVEKAGRRHLFSGFRQKKIQRHFPFVKNTYNNSPLTSAKIEIQSFCPLAVNNMETSALPVVMLEIKCTNPASQKEVFNIVIQPDSIQAVMLRSWSAERYSGAYGGTFLLSCNGTSQWANNELTIPVLLKGGQEKILHIAIAFYDSNWISASQFKSAGEISSYVHTMWGTLKEKTRLFSNAIPQTGDAELDNYLRWYMIPGISLTKCTKNNEVLTMGYIELNQRDSYWTSWLHLVLFKEAERKMIEESITWQQPSGKIPTTILPLIERNDDLDINAFFILRAARFYKYYHDHAKLEIHWPALKKAMDWLLSRDCSGSGLPCQVSFWGDWKDVAGVQGRKYSPFTGFTYLTALKQMSFLSKELGDVSSFRKYHAAYEKGYAFINKPVGEGGLWNGSYYSQIWDDGTVNNHLLQDQTVGILFDVVPHERAVKIFDALSAQSLTPYGIAETTPYYPENFGYAPGTYHNGAVWPWLSFVDCWARVHVDRKDEAIKLIKTVAKADLVSSGDWSPNEHINSQTGKNLGFQLQGWNACLFGLVYFGLVHPGIIP